MGIDLRVSGIKFKIGFVDRYWLDMICTTRIYNLIDLGRQFGGGSSGSGGGDDGDDDGDDDRNRDEHRGESKMKELNLFKRSKVIPSQKLLRTL